MGIVPSLEELIELAVHAFGTLIEDIMQLGDWIESKIAALRDL